jgi:hypothetical protein
MNKHSTWIFVAVLLAAASVLAASAPFTSEEPSSAPAATAPGFACPHGEGGGCPHQGDGGCQGQQGEHQCNGDGSCGCGRFVDENGDTVCDNRGQEGCNCGNHGQQPPSGS